LQLAETAPMLQVEEYHTLDLWAWDKSWLETLSRWDRAETQFEREEILETRRRLLHALKEAEP
jgi:hypothetical protein